MCLARCKRTSARKTVLEITHAFRACVLQRERENTMNFEKCRGAKIASLYMLLNDIKEQPLVYIFFRAPRVTSRLGDIRAEIGLGNSELLLVRTNWILWTASNWSFAGIRQKDIKRNKAGNGMNIYAACFLWLRNERHSLHHSLHRVHRVFGVPLRGT